MILPWIVALASAGLYLVEPTAGAGLLATYVVWCVADLIATLVVYTLVLSVFGMFGKMFLDVHPDYAPRAAAYLKHHVPSAATALERAMGALRYAGGVAGVKGAGASFGAAAASVGADKLYAWLFGLMYARASAAARNEAMHAKHEQAALAPATA